MLSSRDIGERLAEFDLDAGLTYLEGHAPDGTVEYELYRERYLLLTPEDGEQAELAEIGWAEAAQLPLCALSPVMRNRQILDAAVSAAGGRLDPVVETDTVDALYTAVRNRDVRRVTECEARLASYRAAGELPPAAAEALASICARAKAGGWEPAAEKL